MGKINGRGIYYYQDGCRYEGGFKDGKRHGNGIMYNFDGTKLIQGHFNEGVVEGKATVNYIDGSRYEGEVKNGLREGYGILYKRGGFVKKGIWKNDKFEFRAHSKDFELAGRKAN